MNDGVNGVADLLLEALLEVRAGDADGIQHLLDLDALAGVIAAIAKILVYIFLLIMLYNFNKLRTDYEKRRERENK